jgi:hypothetical protein
VFHGIHGIQPGVVHLPLQLGGAEGPEHPGGAPFLCLFWPFLAFGNGTING